MNNEWECPEVAHKKRKNVACEKMDLQDCSYVSERVSIYGDAAVAVANLMFGSGNKYFNLTIYLNISPMCPVSKHHNPFVSTYLCNSFVNNNMTENL